MRPARSLVAALVALGVILVGLPAGARSWTPLPPRQGWLLPPPPAVTAKSWILYDATGDWVVASAAPDLRRAPASTTKMMTALVAVDHADLDDPVRITANATEAGEAEIGLVPGETLKMGDLLKAALVRSANDAAVAIAEAVGGSVTGFVAMMNRKAVAMGLHNTSFANPHGLDEPGHYSSAADLLMMERAVLANPELAAMVRSREITIPPAPDGTERESETTNHLLTTYEGAIGVKTGFTSEAGLVLAAAAQRGERRLLVVVMGSEGERAHIADATALLDYGFASARALPVMRGYPFTLGDGSIDQTAAVAKVEAMAWIAASPVALAPDAEPVIEPEPILVERSPEEVAGWEEALSWAERYWTWLLGEP